MSSEKDIRDGTDLVNMEEECKIWFDEEGLLHAEACPSDIKDFINTFNDTVKKLKKFGKDFVESATINISIAPNVSVSIDRNKLTKTFYEVKHKELLEGLGKLLRELKEHRKAIEG